MGKCIKSIFLSVIAAIFGVIALSGPIFATSNSGNANPSTTETTVVTDENTANTTTNNPTETTTTEEQTDEQSSKASCYDQVGSLGWIICPGAGLFGTIIDGAYNLLTQLIEVNPIPTDTTSPTYIVWEYFKDITNGLFIIFLLVIIFSQITGVGINNYGIKKALPRIVISAILVNLSYIICTIAVDLSNILGNAFQAFFVNVQNIAIQNGTISQEIGGVSVSGVVAAMLGIGTVGAGFASFLVFGSPVGVIWMLLPILLSGLIAVISAVVTMAARQALIYLLVMISPLALIAYMLPNTEKWYKKWYATLAQMLFFYPMFSILYGASQLAGLVIITSATNWLGVVLGIAVKILPLFMSIPLMRMSNTMLGKVSGVINRMSARPVGAFGRYSAEQQARARNAQLNKRNPMLASTRLAQYLDKQRAKRDLETKELAASNALRNLTAYEQGWYRRNGKLSASGLRHYENERAKMDYASTRMNIENDFDEGFKTDGTDKRVRTRDLARVALTNDLYDKATINSAAAESRKRFVVHGSIEHRAALIREHAEKEGDSIHQRVLDSFNIDASRFDTLKARDDAFNKVDAKVRKNGINSLTAEERATYDAGGLTGADKEYFIHGRKALNYTLADAIAARRKLDKEATSIYYELYDDSEAGNAPNEALITSIQNGDYSQANAAIQVMAKRGDHKDIMDILRDNSAALVENDPINHPDPKKIRFQKEINDACLGLKNDNQILWAWAKSNMIRRGKYNHAKVDGEEINMAAFIDFGSFVNGSVIDGDNFFQKDTNGNYLRDGDGNKIFTNDKMERDYNMVAMNPILSNVRDGKLFGDADRTMYNYFVKAASQGKVNPEDYYFTVTKHLRASVCSGKMDGEQLNSFNNYYTMGFSKDGKNNELFNKNKGLVFQRLKEFFKDMNASQLTGLKTATLLQFNDALINLDANMTNEDIAAGKYGKDVSEILSASNRGTTTRTVNGKQVQVSNLLINLLDGEVKQLSEKSSINQRSSMNIAVREMLKIPTDK